MPKEIRPSDEGRKGSPGIKPAVAENGKLPAPKGKPAPVKSEGTQIDGKQIRKDTPVSAATSAFGAETIATELEVKSPEFELADEVVRSGPPVGGATNPIGSETIATEPPGKTDEGPMPQAKKPDAKATAEKGASTLGNYKLLKKLGQGGMGAVYKAQQISDNRLVALKVLSKELASKGDFVKRFQREARAMQKLDHPNVLGCLDVGEAKGFHYLAMEIVDGGSVEGYLKKLGRFSVGDALHIILKTCEAMQHAHENAIIHRDLKPDNILLTKSGIIKVADLGLAKDTDEDVSLTKTGAGAGTPIYMAPEQARDVKHVDTRVDIYALGVMLYVLLTGQPPFQGNTLVELITAKEKGKFEPMRRHNDEVPAKLDLIVDKMIAKDPKFRYASCQEVIDQLAPLGLDNEELSFLDSDNEQTVPNTPQGGKQLKTNVPKKAAGATNIPQKVASKTDAPNKPAGKISTKTSGPSKAAVQNTSIQEEDEVAQKDVWYWKMVTPEGKKVTKKVTTEQIRALIKAGHIDQQAEVSKTANGAFRNAATFMEFQGAFKAREASTKANTKGASYKDQMKEIAAADARRRKYGWISKTFGSFGRTLFGLLWIVLILGLIAGAGYFGYTFMFPN